MKNGFLITRRVAIHARWCMCAAVLLLPGSLLILPLLWLACRRKSLFSASSRLQQRVRRRTDAHWRGALSAMLLSALVLFLGGCTLRHLAVDRFGDALAQSGSSFSADNDPELVRDAAPFSLKLMESLLAERPNHKNLLLASARGFTQYAYAFVQQDADEIEQRDLNYARQLRQRARLMYLRARDYGLRGMAIARPDLPRTLRANPRETAAAFSKEDARLLYWTAAAWAAAIALSKDNPALLADMPVVEALMDRALEVDESAERGAIHTFMISYELVRQGAAGDAAERARKHFAAAMRFAGDSDVAPLVALAESVCVSQQRRGEFESALMQALRFDPNLAPENRLSNIVMQRRARWLLAHIDELFVE